MNDKSARAIIHYDPLQAHLVPFEERNIKAHTLKYQSQYQSRQEKFPVIDKQPAVDRNIAESEYFCKKNLIPPKMLRINRKYDTISHLGTSVNPTDRNLKGTQRNLN